MIIDAHTHVFESIKGYGQKGELRPIGKGYARWGNGEVQAMIPEGYGDKEFTGESLIRLMDNNGIDQAVLLQGSFYGFQNEYVSEVVKAYPDRFVAAATLDPFCKGAYSIYDRLMNELGFRILKIETSTGGGLMGYHTDFDIYEVLKPYAEKGERNDRPLVLDIGSPGMASFQTAAIRRLALEHPRLKIVVCHLFAPLPTDEQALIESLEMTRLPNIWYDLAAMPFNVKPEPYPYPTVLKYIRAAIDIVGADKLMWGTDTPSVLIHDSYANLRDYINEVPDITANELQKILGSNAKTVYW